MNYLGHLFLTREAPHLMAGVFMGDHVKGSLIGERPAHIETGIQFHRTIDAFVDRHQVQHQSIQRLPSKFRRYGGIICDVVYDYYLANHWQKFAEPAFEDFCLTTYQQILDQEASLSEEANRVIRRMAEYRSLEGYGSRQYVERSLGFISERLKRANPLKDAYREFEILEPELEQDFLNFLPEVDNFAQQWLRIEAESA